MVFNFNKSDYMILDVLNNSECYSSVMSFTFQKISDETKLSVPKVRITIKNFLIAGFVKEGAKENNSKTFYITHEGVDFLTKAMSPEVNIEEE